MAAARAASAIDAGANAGKLATRRRASPPGALRIHASACSSVSSADNSASASLYRSAVSPPTGSPPSTISTAWRAPTRRGKRCVPPAPGSNPSLISGNPSEARGDASR
ncbi:3-hydroxyacyl-CoA dehydrogenase, NAD-binding domain protein [Bordetella bronchiseptica]|nr:3-hydroxyacyl-CoA dehydrogenase, NAD-binding domain protein [Bordetella bronchiseptica]